jgi:uncharacterized protein YndB with AHSA1/START domain
MSVTTGRGTVERDGESFALRFVREYEAPIADVWSAVATPERAARWIGELRGTPGVGERVDLVMGDTADEVAALEIIECREPHRIMLGWQFPGTPRTSVTVDLAAVGPDRTSVTLRHSGWKRDEIAGYGCGWQHYADALAAHLAGGPLPVFDDYYPALLPYWRGQAASA